MAALVLQSPFNFMKKQTRKFEKRSRRCIVDCKILDNKINVPTEQKSFSLIEKMSVLKKTYCIYSVSKRHRKINTCHFNIITWTSAFISHAMLLQSTLLLLLLTLLLQNTSSSSWSNSNDKCLIIQPFLVFLIVRQ